MVIENANATQQLSPAVVWDDGYNTTTTSTQLQQPYTNNISTITDSMVTTASSTFGYENFFFSMKGSYLQIKK
jgi:hypothetical protein